MSLEELTKLAIERDGLQSSLKWQRKQLEDLQYNLERYKEEMGRSVARLQSIDNTLKGVGIY